MCERGFDWARFPQNVAHLDIGCMCFAYIFRRLCCRAGEWQLEIERLQRRRLCGRLRQGGGDSSRALWGHLWNRLTNVSLLCHKDTRLTKLAINVPFTTHLFVTQVFIPAVPRTVLPWLTRPWAIPWMSSTEGSPWGTVLDDSESWWAPPGCLLHSLAEIKIKIAFIYIQASMRFFLKKQGGRERCYLLFKHSLWHLIAYGISVKQSWCCLCPAQGERRNSPVIKSGVCLPCISSRSAAAISRRGSARPGGSSDCFVSVHQSHLATVAMAPNTIR